MAGIPTEDLPFATIRKPAGWLDEAIPLFAPRPEHVRDADRYDRDDGPVDLYTGIAYGHLIFGEGAAEGLYRTMSSFVLASGAGDVLDVGCGVGRLLYDCATAMASSRFCGLDLAYRNCRRAHRILRSGEPVTLDAWAHRGRPAAVLAETKRLENVWIAQGSALALPFAPATFDAVCATLLLCQLDDPLTALAEMTRVLRPGGQLFLATPFGFRLAEHWTKHTDLAAAVKGLGYVVEQWFDGLLYREVLDARGNAHEWRVTCIAARAAV
jgi:ubiquinone/menaquinone biosynthesis C-methylase UbiE